MSTTTKAAKSNEVASLFLVQKLEDIRQRMKRCAESIRDALARGDRMPNHDASFLYDVCLGGEIPAILSARQAAWLAKLLIKEGRHNRYIIKTSERHKQNNPESETSK